MAGYNYNNYYNPNQQMLNSLERQKENINNLIAQYSQPQQPVAPVQNIINTNSSNMDFEAKIINENDDPANIAITRKTLFINEAKKKMYIKEVDGTISKEYDIIVPLDEKDKKIMELEERIRRMEEKENVKYAKSNKSNDEFKQSNAISNEPNESSTETISKSISKAT